MMLLALLGLSAAYLPLALAALPRPHSHLVPRGNTTAAAADDVVHIMGVSPKLPYDERTTPYCTYWIDNNGQEVCEEIPEWWGISMDDFLRWVGKNQTSTFPMENESA